MKGVASVVAAVSVLTVGMPSARGDLQEVAGRVAQAWRLAGGDVGAAAPRFLNEDETVSVALPPGPKTPCFAVALLGARGMSFRVRVPSGDDDDDRGIHPPVATAASVAGVLFLQKCGATTVPERLIVTSDAGRGALEVVVARGRSPMPALGNVLPERTGGAVQVGIDAGELPSLLPPLKRAEAAELRARRDGGVTAPRASFDAGNDGNGTGAVALEAGCHRVELFGAEARPASGVPLRRRGRLDLDAELRGENEEILARDRTEAADARLEACVGDAVQGEVSFVGSAPRSPVLMTHTTWPLPTALPQLWGSDARARMASALLARHAVLPAEAATVFLGQGPSGQTTIPLELEPGACYLATAAITHGSARGLGLRANLGLREVADERGVGGAASAVAFCALEERSGRVTVEARGTALAWAVVVYRVRGGVWGARR